MVEREKVTVNDRDILKNYWYKFLIQLIQKEIDDACDVFQNALGTEVFQLLCDLLENQEELVNSIVFKPDDFDERLREIGNRIEDNVDESVDCEWVFNNMVVCVDSNRVNGYSSQLFDDLILPYLQLEHDAVIRITGTHEGLIHFFEYHLSRNNYSLHEKATTISSVEVLVEDSWAVEWKDQNKFLIKCDLNSLIPITLRVKPLYGEIVDKTLEITFPFFEKNDMVLISIFCKECNWFLSAINENNDLEFASEINI